MMKGDLGSLIGTGFALGVFHVLTGPDHLSALATLSANVGSLEAAFLGIRWGVGHSSGLLLVGTILILLTDSSQDKVHMPDFATHLFESIVGVFMLLLGAYGVRRAWIKRPQAFYNAIDGEGSPTKEKPSETGDGRGEEVVRETTRDGIFTIDSGEFDTSAAATSNNYGLRGDYPNNKLEIYFEGEETPVCVPPVFGQTGRNEDGGIIAIPSDESDLEEAVVVEQAYMQTVSPSRCRRCLNNVTRRISTKTLAFIVGIVHGLAGPGGVLGVIPAVQLHNWRLAVIYLGCFCVSSTITMGCFATIYGTCSSKIVGNGTDTRREFQIECFSACLSILVGITWITLLSLGKLEDVFP